MSTHATTTQSKGKGNWKGYLFLGLLVNSAIWSSAVLYLRIARPTYMSEWALILPGSTPGVDINLPNIGQASSSSTSPFGGPTLDPRANYEYIATSETVLTKVAASMKMTLEDFGEPRVKLLDNTTIMHFQVKGSSAKEAQQKGVALNQGLSNQIQLLRVEELARRDEGVQATLRAAKTKLQEAQRQLSKYKLTSGLSFSGQVENLSVNLEQLRRQRAETLAQQRQTVTRLKQLMTSLQISPQQAANAFVLQADQMFQQNLKDYSEASTTLTVLLSKWGPNHPAVLKEQAKQQAAQVALLDRSNVLLGSRLAQPALEYLQLDPDDQGSSRASLFHDLIAVQADAQGLTAEVQSLQQQIDQLETRLDGLAQRQSVLENLQRDQQTAEAVFASTLAKLDLGKSDIFTAYPLVQMLQKPSLPEKPSSPNKTLVVAGAFLGSCFSSMGLILLWQRKRRYVIVRNSGASSNSLPPSLPLGPSFGSNETV